MRRSNIFRSIDWVTVGMYLLLTGLGWLNIYAAVYNDDHASIFDFSQRYGKQLAWILASFVIIIALFIIDSKFFSFFAYLIYILCILALLGVLIFGKEVNGSRSWYELGIFNLQPGEFAKIGTALALARLLSSYNFRMHSYSSILKIILIILLPPLLIILQPDMGSALIYAAFLVVIYREGFSVVLMVCGILFIILFFAALVLDKFYILAGLTLLGLLTYWIISRRPGLVFRAVLVLGIMAGLVWGGDYLFGWGMNIYLKSVLSISLSAVLYLGVAMRKRLRRVYVIVLILILSVGYSFSIDYVFNNVLKEHQRRRVSILIGLEDDPLGMGYNVNQSKIAIGSGGLSGKGFLQGTQTKFDFVPEQSTDFIFCTVGEEWGFIGTSFVIILFVLLMLRIVYLAERQRSDFSRIYAYGVVSVLLFHFVVNIGMTIGLLPVIGIPLPFLSYGGSSLWSFTILLFILVRLDASRMDLVR